MAYDQNSVPKDLRPLNIVRTVPEDPRISPATSCGSSGRPIEGYYASPPTDGSPGNMPTLYYPAAVTDAGFVPLAFNNAITGVTGWVQHIVPTQPQQGVVGAAVINTSSGYTTSPNYGAVCGCSPSDHNSEEGGDDSVSGRKVKFLCSFGGKILPRLSDGTLRYVGGQTRIISVKRDVSFGEFVRKMTDTYVENVVIKYQLPDEDLDALVSVSCVDDLENMMDEYEKLSERSSDGSAKLRIFLFSPSELDSVQIGDLQDGGLSYVEAVNGVTEGSSSGSRIARKESIESAVSGQNSDLSGTEGADSFCNVLGEVSVPSTGGFSPTGNHVFPFDTAPRMVCVDPNTVSYPDTPPLTTPKIKSGPTTGLGAFPEQEVERSVPLSAPQTSPVVSFQASSPYMPAYVDPHQETLNHANYVHLPSQMGFPSQILGPMRPVFTQQPIPAGASPQQFTPAVNMTMNPAYISMRQNVFPAVVQPQHVRLEHYPAESMLPKRVVQLSAEQGYSAYQSQIPATPQGGVYNWNQIPHPEQVTYSEGGLPPQPVRFEDCHMCQKALPHAHSDTVAQEQKESPSTASDLRSVYCSLPVDGRGQPIVRNVVAGNMAEGNVERRAREDREFGKLQTEAVEGQNLYDRSVPQKAETPEASKVPSPQGVMMTGGVQLPYGVYMANTPQSQANAVQNLVVQPQLQVAPDTMVHRPLNSDFTPGGLHMQGTDYVIPETPKEYPANVTGGIPIDASTSLAYDNLRQIDGRLENLRIRPEVPFNTEQNKTVMDFPSTESYQATDTPVYSGIDPTHPAERILPINEWKDNLGWSQPKIAGDLESVTHDGSSISPSNMVGDTADNSASLFVNQDPWNMRPDTQFPPPRPAKIQLRRENAPTGNYKDSLLETSLDDISYQPSSNLNRDPSLDQSSSEKGSAEERVKQELQAVAEGVAASVLHSSVPSNPDLSVYAARSASPPMTQENGDIPPANADIQQNDRFEDMKTNYSVKINLGFPASGIGRLQIIKNTDLEELRELGSGTFGTVYHGKWRGTDVAIKRINDRCFAGKPSEQERMRDDFWNEAIKLADLHHPNVVAFYGVVLDGPDDSVATVTEYMVNGSLRNALQKNERNLDKRKRLLIGMDVAFGMEYLHGKNIVHFDLKSDNLLVNLRDPHRPICKVGDLGLSKVKCHTLISGGVRGTLPWMAPELLNGSSSLVSEKVDVFSFGIVMWELLTGEEPYGDLHYGAIIGGIVSNTLRPSVPESCDPDWRALMERCWLSEPSERPNFTEIADELRAMANKLPSKGQVQQQLPSINPQVKS
ncbi:hypothetical protein ACS0TY_021185 [Phlomoides rotata]